MVKGLSKNVVVVRFPDTRMFEQAIFIVRGDGAGGVSAAQIVEEACVVAESYVRRKKGKTPPRWLFAAAGAGFVAAAWLIWGITMWASG